MEATDWRDKKAVIFDLDGTLYLQKPVRRAMLIRLLRAHALRPVEGYRTFRFLQAFRHAQEELRSGTAETSSRQIELACERAAIGSERGAALVERWMEREPLDLLRLHRRDGAAETLKQLRRAGKSLGLLSDYPAAMKLDALEIREHFDVVVSAQDSDVGAFKPSPRGIAVALGKLDVDPGEAVYVGDRADVDYPAASAAGVECAIFTESASREGFVAIQSFGQLASLLLG